MRLKIVLVDSNAERSQALEAQLCETGFADVVRVATGPDLTAAVARIRPDLVIVDMALPDRDALEDIRAVSGTHPIVMFAGSDDPAFAEDAIAAGVCSYNLSGAADADIRPIVQSAIALFRRYRRMQSELEEAKAKLDERRLIERAKAILMRNRKMSEPEAYDWLRRKAMNAKKKIGHIAADLVKKEQASAGTKGDKE
jgi:response regulator NasT